MYIQCTNSEEIAKISSHVKNISTSNLKEDNAAIAIHIPKILYNQYISIEKLMFHIRQSSLGNVQTNIRLGKTDFICRQKLKSDRCKWKEITPIEVHPHIAKPDLELVKNQKTNSHEEEVQELYNYQEEM